MCLVESDGVVRSDVTRSRGLLAGACWFSAALACGTERADQEVLASEEIAVAGPKSSQSSRVGPRSRPWSRRRRIRCSAIGVGNRRIYRGFSNAGTTGDVEIESYRDPARGEP